MEPTLEEKLAVASELILQAPPGEVNDVFNDVRPIVGDDSEIEQGLLPALTQYNIEQFTLVELPNAKMPAMICPGARVELSSNETRYLDPRSSQTFVFDHLRLCAMDVLPFTPENEEIEKIRLELDAEAEQYVQDHFHGGIWSVFSQNKTPPESLTQPKAEKQIELSEPNTNPSAEATETGAGNMSPGENETEENLEVAIDSKSTAETVTNDECMNKEEVLNKPAEENNILDSSTAKFQLYIVGSKYNPGNYWTGRWRSVYEIDMSTAKIEGHINVNVHYYEQGNVQLATQHQPSIDLISAPANAAQVMKAIQQTESTFQNGLNAAYLNLGDNTFKQLRRALPVTKQKANWNNMRSKIVFNDEN
ncbi:hypothetical protein O181_051162 [Austropuccinia psidii MF-1]|uniref:F-actin-capping protein subunit alpha n=1 Tax=Austropuccinia psidii MF-1 TaxID=1389203 RepID=A0A9Q3E0D8_9BASI|nr:hypothetical protein [Austropuccinia psidii MF-1]